jgi:IclR family acetate operon transcriptional repressor
MRSVTLLQALAEEPEGLSVRRLSEITGTSRSTVHRLLQGLAELGMAQQTESGSYRMGPKLFELATVVLAHSSVVQVSDSLMRELVAETGETVYVAMLSADRRTAVHVHRVDSPEPLRYLVPRGSRFPIYAGAAGKAILAFLGPPWDLDRLEPITENTITDRAALEAQLEGIRRSGFSVTLEERVKGAAGVAAPLVVRGEVVGSLTLSVPVARLPEAGLEQFGPLVVEYAERVSTAIAVLGRSEFDGI